MRGAMAHGGRALGVRFVRGGFSQEGEQLLDTIDCSEPKRRKLSSECASRTSGLCSGLQVGVGGGAQGGAAGIEYDAKYDA